MRRIGQCAIDSSLAWWEKLILQFLFVSVLYVVVIDVMSENGSSAVSFLLYVPSISHERR